MAFLRYGCLLTGEQVGVEGWNSPDTRHTSVIGAVRDESRVYDIIEAVYGQVVCEVIQYGKRDRTKRVEEGGCGVVDRWGHD